MSRILLALDAISTALLAFMLVGIWVFRDLVFTVGAELEWTTLLMLIGYGSFLVLGAVSLAWMQRGRSVAARQVRSTPGLRALGLASVGLVAADMVMINEVAHETADGWTLQTEFVILYAMLGVQLLYNLRLASAVRRAAGLGERKHGVREGPPSRAGWPVERDEGE